MFNKKVKVVDCTIRDGGLINKWQFSDELVRNVFKAINASGVDYMEIGYRASEKMFSPEEYGPWRFSKDDKIRQIIGDEELKTKLGVMVDIGRVEPDDIAPADESPLSFIRVATYLKDVNKAIALANQFEDKDYETFINIMAISTVNNFDIQDALKHIEAETDVIAVNVVDSFGSLYPDIIDKLVKLFCENVGKKEVGVHLHNNQQLAFANSMQALQSGAGFCDATIKGIGRAAGNCPLELLIAWLKNPKYNLEPLIDCIENDFVALAQEIEWGYLIPYMITGILNEHPRVAIALRESEHKDEYGDFFRKLTTPECLNK